MKNFTSLLLVFVSAIVLSLSAAVEDDDACRAASKNSLGYETMTAYVTAMTMLFFGDRIRQ